MPKGPLIIFDMDGVLVDVTGSYREVVRYSAAVYLRDVIGVNISDELFISLSDVAAIKKSGGLNNDWDLTCAIINTYLIHSFDMENYSTRENARKLREIHDDAEVFGSVRDTLKGCDRLQLEATIREKSIQSLYFERDETECSTSPFLVNHGDVKTGNLVKRIFQEIYLGKQLFEEIYGERPLFFRNSGYIEREVLIPKVKQLGELFESSTLSIATGRPEVEALYAIKHFQIEDFFTAVVSEDDVVNEENKMGGSFRKPHPFSINLCIRKSGFKNSDPVYYIGDMPDDMIAARQAGVKPIGFVNRKGTVNGEDNESHRNLLVGKGAQEIFCNYQDLIRFFSM